MSAEGVPKGAAPKEAGRQFVDANVVVYAHDETAGAKRERARTLLEELWSGRAGSLSVQVLQEVYVTLTAKVPKPLEASTAATIVSDLSRWHVHVPGPDDVAGAIALHRRHRIGFWDAMIVWSAQREGCTILWSEDLSHGQLYDGVRVRNPFRNGG
jgi:predicted nucleic acid-binding protein